MPTSIIFYLLSLFPFVAAFVVGSFYRFPFGNHGQEIPPIQELCTPGVFTGDFAILSFTGFGPRFFYNHLMCGMTRFGLDLPDAYFFLHLISVLAVLAALFYVGRMFFSEHENIFSAVCLAAFVVLNVFTPTQWDSAFLPDTPIPSTFSMAFVSWGLVLALHNKWLWAYTLFGVGALLQFLVGFLPGVLFLIPAFLSIARGKSTAGFLSLFLGVFAWGIALGCIYIPMTLKNLPVDSELSREIFQFFGVVRVPHHWLPSTASWWHWPNFMAGYAGAMILLFNNILKVSGEASQVWKVPHVRYSLVGLVMGSAILLCCNYIFVEIIFIETIGKLQFQRVMPFARFGVFIILVNAAYLLWQKERRWFAVCLLLAPLFELYGAMLLVLTCLIYSEEKCRNAHKILNILGVILIFTLVIFSLNVYPMLSIKRLILGVLFILTLCAVCVCQNRLSWLLVLNALTVTILILIFYFPQTLSTKSYIEQYWHRKYLVNDDIAQLALNIKEKTLANSTILIPPTGEFQMFSYISQRPVFFSWKNIPYDVQGIQEWRSRLTKLTGKEVLTEPSQQELENAFATLHPDYLENIMKEHQVRYIVSNAEWHDFTGAVPILTSGEWVLWQISKKESI